MSTKTDDFFEVSNEMTAIQGVPEEEIMLSRHFSLDAMVRSDLARKKSVDNTPNATQIENLRYMCTEILDPLRDKLNKPIQVVSAFRSRELNAMMFDTSDSWHLAEDDKVAVEIVAKGVSLKRMAEAIDELGVPFDKIMLKYDQGVMAIQARRPRRENVSRKIVSGMVRYQTLKDRF